MSVSCESCNVRGSQCLCCSYSKNTAHSDIVPTEEHARKTDKMEPEPCSAPQPACTKAREALTVLPAGRPANLLSNACRCRQNLQRAVRPGLTGQQTIHRNPTLRDIGLFSCRCGRCVLLILRLFNNGVSTAHINMTGNVRRVEYAWIIRLTIAIEHH
jgi:hypothetical protein